MRNNRDPSYTCPFSSNGNILKNYNIYIIHPAIDIDTIHQSYSDLLSFTCVCVCKSIQFSTYEIYVSITTVQTLKSSSSTWIPLVFLTILTILPFPLLLIPVCSTLFLDYDFNVNVISSEAPSLILVLVIYVFFLC